jgi:hypothetical protein
MKIAMLVFNAFLVPILKKEKPHESSVDLVAKCVMRYLSVDCGLRRDFAVSGFSAFHSKNKWKSTKF